MLSRKSFVVIAFAVSLTVLYLSSRRSLEAYRRPTPAHAVARPQAATNTTTPTTTTILATHVPHAPHESHDPLCDDFPDTSNILLVMKTGASEAYPRIPTNMMTTMRCHAHFLLFGDKDMDIAGHHIYDSLDTVAPSARDGNPDFDLYRRQQTCFVDMDHCNKLGDPATEGWTLDKYKNNRIAEKVMKMRPDYDWYLFVDADSYVLWRNLVPWLRTVKATEKHYLGSVTMLGDFPLGHGGSGYLVTKPAMREFAAGWPAMAESLDKRARNECCGDFMFAFALKQTANVGVEHMWPTINGEQPATLPFGPSHWCHPVVTMHHLSANEIDSFWQFEQRRWRDAARKGGPLLLKEIFHEFVEPHVADRRDDWDNLGDDRFYLDRSRKWEEWQLARSKAEKDLDEAERHAHESPEACARACEGRPHTECFQWKFSDACCSFSASIKRGYPVRKPADDAKRVYSGWDVKKIRKWVADQGECAAPLWPKMMGEWHA